jgi:acyl-CoA dehydrogenase
MTINLEIPKKFGMLINQAQQVSTEIFRPISRKYDQAEHEYPKELDMLASLIDGMNASGESSAGARGVRRDSSDKDKTNKNGTNMSGTLSIIEACWGDVAMVLSMPRQGLGNAAIASVANDEQHARFDKTWASMAITEPGFGSDSAAVTTTAVKDGEDYIINGEKIFVTAGERSNAVVVWATLDKSLGRAAIKSFVVEKGTPGMVVERLEHKLGIRASDTATIRFTDCRVPAANLMGSAEIETESGFGGVMQTFDNTRPLVAGMAVGCARAALDDLGPARRCRGGGRLRPAGLRPAGCRCGVSADGGRLGGCLPAHHGGHLDGRQQPPELAAGLDGQGEGGPCRCRDHAQVCRAGRLVRLLGELTAGEVGA